jgi:UDP-glucose 4-epimerase
VYADPSLAQRLLGWRAELDLEAMCRDAWRWQSMNPDGYGEAAVEETAGETVLPREWAALAAG